MQNGFWRIFPENEGIRAIQSQFSHPWGLNEWSFGDVDRMEDTGLPIVKMNAKEKINFHRPSHGKTTEKVEKGGEVTALSRQYWLDRDGKLNYKTWIGLDGKPL